MADTPKQDRNLGLPRTKLADGRFVTAYDAGLALRIVEQVAEGKLLREICKPGSDFPHPSTFLKWAARVPELGQAYSAAQNISALAMEEEALAEARHLQRNPGTTQKVRATEVLINQLRWSASRRDPQKYGDKGNLNLTVPVQINTSLDMGAVGGVSVDIPDIYTIDVEAVEVSKVSELQSEIAALPPLPLEEPKTFHKDTSGPRKRVLTPKVPMDVSVVELRRKQKAERDKQKNG